MTTLQIRDLGPLAARVTAGLARLAGGQIIYGPGDPIAPVTAERTPRRMQYPMAVNLTWQPRQDWPNLTPFERLRHLAGAHPLAALCIRVRVAQALGVGGRVVARDRRGVGAEAGTADALTAALAMPDGMMALPLWLSLLVREVLEIDAPAVYKRPARGGGIAALDLIDGATLKPLLDDRGLVVGYQQVIYGAALSQYRGRPVAPDETEVVDEWAAGDIWLAPYSARVDSPYGRAPMEDMLSIATTYLRKLQSDEAYFTDGNIPAALAMFDGVQLDLDQVLQFQDDFNAELGGAAARGQTIKFIPFPVKIERLQQLTEGGRYESDWEERMVKLTCALYGVTPAEIGFTADVNRATSEGQENVQYRTGIRPMQMWLKAALIDPLIQRDLAQPQLEWQWDSDGESEDAERTARIDNIYYGAGAVSSDELRRMRYPDLAGAAPGGPQVNATAGVPMPGAPAAKRADGPADEARRRSWEARLEDVVARVFGGQRGRLRAALESAADPGALLAGFFGDEQALMARALLGLYDEIIADAADAALGVIGRVGDWEMVNEAVLRLARREAAALAAQTTATTQARAGRIIADWVEAGGTLDDLSDRLGMLYPPARARAIAATEVTRLYAHGNAEAWSQSGIVTGYTWETTRDEAVCPRCGPRAGRRYAGFDISEMPPAHVGCRCWITPLVEGD